MVRDAFDLAKEKIKNEGRKGIVSRLGHLLHLLTPGAIIFIDELDAIGTKRYGGEQSGDREVQRTMLELLNQLDGFSSSDKIKVIAATNRPGNRFDSRCPSLWCRYLGPSSTSEWTSGSQSGAASSGREGQHWVISSFVSLIVLGSNRDPQDPQ